MSDRRLFLKQLTAGLGGALVAQEVGAVDLEDEGASYITPATPPDPDGLFFFEVSRLKMNGYEYRKASLAVSFAIECYPAPEQFSGQYPAGVKRPIVQEPAAGYATVRVPGPPKRSITLGEFTDLEWTHWGKLRVRFRGTVRRLDLLEAETRIHVVNEHPAEGLLQVSDMEKAAELGISRWTVFGVS